MLFMLNKNQRSAFVLLFLWVITLAGLYSILSIVRHNHFQSGGFDLGLYDQAIWLYSRLQMPYSTIKERLILGDHLTLTLPLLAPLYYLWDDVRLLLVFQAVWTTVSAVPIYLIGIKRRFSAFASLILAIIYSLFYGIQFAIQFDFHPVMIGVGLLAWLAYFLESGKRRLLLIGIFLLLLTQENMGLALTSLGLIYVWQKQLRRTAFGFIIGGIIATFVAIKLTAQLSPIGFEYTPQIALEPLSLLQQFFDSEEKRLVWWYSFAWFGFLPLFAPGAVAAVAFDLAQYFLTGNALMRMWSPYAHHRAILAVFLALGTFEVLNWLKKHRIKPEVVVSTMFCLVLLLQYVYHFPLNKLIKKEFWHEETWMADNRKILAMIPSVAKVAAPQNLVPHLSHRSEIYLAWPRERGNDWWLEFAGQPEFLVVDQRSNQWLTQILTTNANWQTALKNMIAAGKIRLFQNINTAYLYLVNY